jgi:hypothetical protein
VSLTARVLRGPTLAFVTDLPLAREKRWQDQLNQPGSGSVVLQNDDPALPAILDGDVIQFRLDGVVVFAFIVRSRETATIAETPDQQTTELAGPGILAVLDRALVYPLPGLDSQPVQDRRLFSWPAYDYDDSAWGNAVEMATVAGVRGPTVDPDRPLVESEDTSYWLRATMPKWPEPNAWWLWTNTGPAGAPIDFALEWSPAGEVYFRKRFTCPDNVIALQYHAVFDGWGELWLDGQQLATGTYGVEPNVNTFNGSIPISGGVHQFAAYVGNDIDPEGDEIHNPGALLLAAYAVDAAGGYIAPAPLVISDASWKALPYPPATPGMTPGEALRHVIAEAQGRGALTELVVTFTDEADSDGAPWPVAVDIATAVGNDVLAFARELCTTYIDLWLDPATWRLYAWLQDGRGTDRPVVLHGATDPYEPLSGNVRGLVHRRVL